METRQPFLIIRFLIAVAMSLVIVALTSFAEAQQGIPDRTGRFVFGSAVGLQADTIDGTAFALGFYGDYYVTSEFSVGPLLQMGFTDDLFQYGITAQAKYSFDLAGIPELKPHVQAGIGIIHADLDRRGGRKENDTSYLIPIGIGAEHKLSGSLTLDTTFLFNTTNLDIQDERFFFTWLIGLKFPF